MSGEEAAGQLAYLAAGVVGCGFVEASLRRGLDRDVAFIGVDAGSTDPGPRYLAGEQGIFGHASYVRDLRGLLLAARSADIPLLIGSAAGSGNNWSVDYFATLIREIAHTEGLTFTLAKIYAEQEPETILSYLDSGRVRPLAAAPPYDADVIRRSQRIVAVMGVEPFQDALEAGADVIVAGRATDTAIYAAIPLARGIDPAVAWHAAKIAECGTSAAEPRGRMDVLLLTLESDSFTVEPLRDEIRCTPMSVAAVQLHEVADPFRMIEPGWITDLSDVRYTAASDRRVHAAGAVAQQVANTNKLEGVEFAGYQSMFLCGVRDPTIIESLDAWMNTLQSDIRTRCAEVVGVAALENCQVTVRVYGRDGVLGDREPLRHQLPHEVALVVDVVSSEEAITHAVIEIVEYAYQHGKSPRWRGHGTLAYPFSQRIFHVGPVYAFNVHHVVCEPDPNALFTTQFEVVG
jgi:hypothetical protein